MGLIMRRRRGDEAADGPPEAEGQGGQETERAGPEEAGDGHVPRLKRARLAGAEAHAGLHEREEEDTGERAMEEEGAAEQASASASTAAAAAATAGAAPVYGAVDDPDASNAPLGVRTGTVARGTACEMCEREEAKYCCPRCGLCSCSLRCCQAHKKEYKCNGKRDRTAYRSISAFGDADLRSDLHFLEDVMRCSDSGRRTLRMTGGTAGSGGRHNSGNSRNHGNNGGNNSDHHRRPDTSVASTSLSSSSSSSSASDAAAPGVRGALALGHAQARSPALRKLVREAQRRDITLLLMPTGMTKRKENSTRCNGKSIAWKVELIFEWTHLNAQGDSSVRRQRYVEARVAETATVQSILDRYLTPQKGNAPTRHLLRAVVQHRSTLQVLLPRVPSPAHDPQHFVVEPSMSLADALRGKTIVEHPTLHVVPLADPALQRRRLFIAELPPPLPPPSAVDADEEKQHAVAAETEVPVVATEPVVQDVS